MDLTAEEDALGDWPRRLLHVPTLTSYEWQPGNTYNGMRSPTYNVITYTWGRYRLGEQERLDVHAVPIIIDGGHWDIPRIDPDHFTAEEFEKAIRMAGTFTSPPTPVPVEFLWLDVACIDQRDGEPRSAAEIGRQGVIFRGACKVFVWLTSLDRPRLDETLKGAYGKNSADDPDPSQIYHMISLFSDPWFSSLWTLQEACLRGEGALLLSRDGSLIAQPSAISSEFTDYFEFGWLCYISTRWHYNCKEVLFYEAEPNVEVYQEFIDVLADKGLYHIYTRNELAMYEAAQRRVTLRPEDRIYGIQQIFGFRVGKSALSTPPDRDFTIEELEDQFGEQMLLHYPVLSQFHCFTQYVPAAKRWRFRKESRMLPISLMGTTRTSVTSNVSNGSCSFWVDYSVSGKKPVVWKGLITSLRAIKRAWDHLLSEDVFLKLDPPMKSLGDGRQDGMINILLDRVEELASIHESNDDIMAETYLQLEELYPNQGLKILFLGPPHSRDLNMMAGLLLTKGSDLDWVRLGICHWSVPYWTELECTAMASLSGQGDIWKQSQGMFGYLS
ncbi:hypothetical protein BDV96DRAFT_639314 [Lophiotrema nucula]|uniref:Heterokaryon incompatibility domain-containing protein n=1 Tax=Lophiotrema nucula TaxID=690887 RepID=A0A6A5ZVB3_9PLEO|nr:hypothetical protein BDV96DRAFT_639314 [Lophiotrema nucula]